ncbi:tetraspanin-1-like [Haliotis asinina]|uniref:tetraspanin-1-like n=1 Tax=Haliotis asinina TaxID=109174 RepID=UPI003531946A
MSLGCCGKTFSCLFSFCNVVFSIIGVVTVGTGIFIKVHPSPAQFLTNLDVDGYDQYVDNSAWIIIVFGALVLLVSLCGCVGAYNKSKCLLGMYITFTLIVVFGALAVWISTIIIIVKFQTIRESTPSVTKILQSKYKGEATAFTKPWNFLQSQFQCCGVSNFTDYHVVFTGKDQGKVPKSCCMSSDNNPEAPSIVSCPEYSEPEPTLCFKQVIDNGA